ncbi:MAG TPA: hypothetical protein VMF50_04910 [Candidatus Binataceae bacterium]|nr:hypothetical protein [Candidatus Binataceae bacterium]
MGGLLDDGFDIRVTNSDGTVTRYRSRKRKAPPKPPKPVVAPATTWTLDIDDLIQRTGMSRRWLFTHADELPFIRRITRKSLRGDAAKLEKWLDAERRK